MNFKVMLGIFIVVCLAIIAWVFLTLWDTTTEKLSCENSGGKCSTLPCSEGTYQSGAVCPGLAHCCMPENANLT
jgi:hypothetical protein